MGEGERRVHAQTALFGPHAIGRGVGCGGECGAGECARHQWKERWKYETIRCSDLMKYVSTAESASLGFSYRKLCATLWWWRRKTIGSMKTAEAMSDGRSRATHER